VSLTRRELLRLAAAAAATPLGARSAASQAAAAAQPLAAGRFFSGPELALLDELTERILPADAHSGGARAAGVAGFIDGKLAEFGTEIPDLRETRERWRAGLAAVEARCREASGKAFLDASPEEQVAVLEALAKAEERPHTDVERFFAELKEWTAHTYYTSKVGIHDEMEYKGNTLLQEFVGTDPATLPGGPAKD
jgi:hypothetical protein